MITIPEAVEEFVNQEPYLEEALSRDIINTSALARSLKPRIEERLLKSVQTGAIVMALKRLSKQNKTKANPKFIFKNKPDIIVRSNLVEFTIANSDTAIDTIRQLLEKNPVRHRHFLTFTQGVYETAIITSAEWMGVVEGILSGEKLLGKEGNLSCLTIILPDTNVVTPGVYYFILKSLAWENINIIDVVSTKEEFTIILRENDIDRAFSTLKNSLK